MTETTTATIQDGKIYTHDGSIRSWVDPMSLSWLDYVWVRCDRWGQPDDQAEAGWRELYRPLAPEPYIGNEHVTDELRAAIREHYAARNNARAATKASSQATPEPAKAAPIDVPTAAIAAYRRYGGDAERAWEAEDEQAWSMINRYADAIEAQRLASLDPDAVREITRSDSPSQD